MVIDIAAEALGALRDGMNYSFRPDRACQDVEVISDKLAIPLTSTEFANFSERSVLSRRRVCIDKDLLEKTPSIMKKEVS